MPSSLSSFPAGYSGHTSPFPGSRHPSLTMQTAFPSDPNDESVYAQLASHDYSAMPLLPSPASGCSWHSPPSSPTAGQPIGKRQRCDSFDFADPPSSTQPLLDGFPARPSSLPSAAEDDQLSSASSFSSSSSPVQALSPAGSSASSTASAACLQAVTVVMANGMASDSGARELMGETRTISTGKKRKANNIDFQLQQHHEQAPYDPDGSKRSKALFPSARLCEYGCGKVFTYRSAYSRHKKSCPLRSGQRSTSPSGGEASQSELGAQTAADTLPPFPFPQHALAASPLPPPHSTVRSPAFSSPHPSLLPPCSANLRTVHVHGELDRDVHLSLPYCPANHSAEPYSLTFPADDPKGLARLVARLPSLQLRVVEGAPTDVTPAGCSVLQNEIVEVLLLHLHLQPPVRGHARQVLNRRADLTFSSPQQPPTQHCVNFNILYCDCGPSSGGGAAGGRGIPQGGDHGAATRFGSAAPQYHSGDWGQPGGPAHYWNGAGNGGGPPGRCRGLHAHGQAAVESLHTAPETSADELLSPGDWLWLDTAPAHVHYLVRRYALPVSVRWVAALRPLVRSLLRWSQPALPDGTLLVHMPAASTSPADRAMQLLPLASLCFVPVDHNVIAELQQSVADMRNERAELLEWVQPQLGADSAASGSSGSMSQSGEEASGEYDVDLPPVAVCCHRLVWRVEWPRVLLSGYRCKLVLVASMTLHPTPRLMYTVELTDNVSQPQQQQPRVLHSEERSHPTAAFNDVVEQWARHMHVSRASVTVGGSAECVQRGSVEGRAVYQRLFTRLAAAERSGDGSGGGGGAGGGVCEYRVSMVDIEAAERLQCSGSWCASPHEAMQRVRSEFSIAAAELQLPWEQYTWEPSEAHATQQSDRSSHAASHKHEHKHHNAEVQVNAPRGGDDVTVHHPSGSCSVERQSDEGSSCRCDNDMDGHDDEWSDRAERAEASDVDMAGADEVEQEHGDEREKESNSGAQREAAEEDDEEETSLTSTPGPTTQQHFDVSLMSHINTMSCSQLGAYVKREVSSNLHPLCVHVVCSAHLSHCV